jgi:hypothetical protein
MSWEVFKNNVFAQLNGGVSDIDTVASAYATEYDNAIKRGYDKQNLVPLQQGNVDSMKSLIKSALERGLSSKEPYDLIGNFGDAVRAYWMGGQMNTVKVPITPAPGSVSNISVTAHTITNPGMWQAPVNSGVDFKLSEPQVEEIKQELKYYKEKLKTATTEEQGPTEDKINLSEGKLDTGEDVSFEVTFDDEITAAETPGQFNKGNAWPARSGGFGYNSPYTPPTFTPDMKLGEKIVAAARADIGVAMETEGPDNGPRVREILKHVGFDGGNAWCASAVTWWWDTAGAARMPTLENPAWVPNWVNWAKKNGQWSSTPAIGAGVVYDFPNGKPQFGDHIGIVSAIASDGSVTTIEGNTGGSNGQGCYERKANMKFVVGYVWPKPLGGDVPKYIQAPKDANNLINKKVDLKNTEQYSIKGSIGAKK